MSKQAIEGAKRGAMLRVDPLRLFIVGVDVNPEGNIDGPEHPLYDERAKIGTDTDAFEGLVSSIMAIGIVEPVIFRKNGPIAEVVAGRQRVKAAREANKRFAETTGTTPLLIPCYQRKVTDRSVLEVMAAENEIRQDTPPMIRARQAERMLARGLDEADVARAFGVQLPAVTRILKLLDLASPVQEALDDRRITQTAALTLVGMTRKKQERLLAKLLDTGQKPTTKAAKAAVEADEKGQGDSVRRRPGRADFRHICQVDLNEPSRDTKILKAVAKWAATGSTDLLEDLGLWEVIEEMLGTTS